jgi:hypothetical protein
MVGILFDPPSENGEMSGGALFGGIRRAYVKLCNQMTSRKERLDYISIRDRILDIIYNDVRGHIECLPDKDRTGLIKSVNIIFSNFDKSDNPLIVINIVSLQVALLFTQYEYEKNGGDEEPFIDNKERYHYIMEDGDYKNYSYIKEIIPTLGNLEQLLNPEAPGTIFMVFTGFLRLSELLDSYFNNVFYLGLSYKTQYVDGDLFYPIAYLTHDIFHYEMYTEHCPKFPTIIKGFKDFRNYMSNKDESWRYSIDFALFLFLHEEPYCYTFKNGADNLNNKYQDKATVEWILDSLEENMDALTDINNFGKAIPKEYRVLEEGSDLLLTEESVNEYLQLVAERYVTSWREFRAATAGASGGRRRRTKRNRRKMKKTRKERK